MFRAFGARGFSLKKFFWRLRRRGRGDNRRRGGSGYPPPLLSSNMPYTGGGGEFRGGDFPCGKFRISTRCGISPSFFEGRCGIFPMRNFACVSHHRTRLGFFLGVIMLNKGANVCWCPILRFQTYAESLLVAFLYCVSFGDRNTRIPFVCNALKIWEVRNFPLDFLGQVWNIPRAEFSPAEKTPYRIPPPPPVYLYTTVYR